MTALQWAVKFGHKDIATQLLLNGADPHVQNENGDNILFMALRNSLWDAEDFLRLWHTYRITPDADCNCKSRDGQSLVHMAITKNWKHLVDILLFNEKVRYYNSNI